MRSGTRTGSGRRRPSTSMSRRFGRSWVIRAGSRRFAASAIDSRRSREASSPGELPRRRAPRPRRSRNTSGLAYARNERLDLTDKVERDAVALSTLVEDALEHRTPVPAEVQRVAARLRRQRGGRVLVVDRRGGRRGLRAHREHDSLLGPRSGRTRGRGRDRDEGSRTLGSDLLYVAVPVASSGVVHGAVRITYPMSTSTPDSPLLVDPRPRRRRGTPGRHRPRVRPRAMVSKPLDDLEQAAAPSVRDLSARAPVEDRRR